MTSATTVIKQKLASLSQQVQVCWPMRLIQRCDLCTDFSGKSAHFMGMRLILCSDL